MYKGIDYGHGLTNVDHKAGIRYGVIPASALGQAWYESSDPDYGEATCPECGEAVVAFDEDEHGEYGEPEGKDLRWCTEWACERCEVVLDNEDVWPEDPRGFFVDDEGVTARQSGEDHDIFITKSPYFTYAQFCSPCAPGACYLLNPLDEPDESNKAYCFGPEWFCDSEVPHPIYSVETGELVHPGPTPAPNDETNANDIGC